MQNTIVGWPDASCRLKSGQVGVVPTDTIYGIVASARSQQAVERIYEVKQREPRKPFIILIPDFDALRQFDITPTDKQRLVMEQYWPGPVSLIFPCAHESLTYLHRGTQSLSFRLPNKPELAKLIKETGPLVAPSANPEGEPPAEDIEQVTGYFHDAVDFYVDGGKVTGEPSRLISLLGDKPEIIR